MKIAPLLNLFVCLILCSLVLSSCGNSAPTPTNNLPVKEYSFDFESGDEGWSSSFLGYDADNKDSFNFQSGNKNVPDINTTGMLLSANNPNGQLVMYLQKQLSGLEPNQKYNLLYRVGLATNLSSANTCVGFEGKRTEVKITAALNEPKQTLEDNIGILNLSSSPFQIVGSVGHTDRSCEATDYAINQLGNLNPPFNAPIEITSDAQGSIWSAVVLDSSFIGQSTFYIDSLDITATPIETAE